MGDIIHAMVALQFVKKHIPGSKIDWVVESRFKGVLENNPDIDNILPVDLHSIKTDRSGIFKQIKLLKSYRNNKYDIVIDDQGLIKSAIVAKIIGAEIIAGFDKESSREGVASLLYDKKVYMPYHENSIDRNVRMICEPLGIEVSKTEIVNKDRFLFFDDESNNNLCTDYNIVVIGSTWDNRNYPKEKYLEVVNSLKKHTYIVWGSEEEHQKALWMEKQSHYIEVLPKDNLNRLKSVISNCKLLIGNDTGPTHMAWGLNVPSITIFGPTPINRIYITPINKAIKSSSVINHYKLNKKDFSINEIKTGEIIDIAHSLLK